MTIVVITNIQQSSCTLIMNTNDYTVIEVAPYKHFESEEYMINNVLNTIPGVVSCGIDSVSFISELLDIGSDSEIVLKVRELSDEGKFELARFLGSWRQYLLLHSDTRDDARNDVLSHLHGQIVEIRKKQQKVNNKNSKQPKVKNVPFRFRDPAKFQAFSLEEFTL